MSKENKKQWVASINAMIDKASAPIEIDEKSFVVLKEAIGKDKELTKAILSYQSASKLTDEHIGQLLVNLGRISGSQDDFKDNLQAIKNYLKPEHQELELKLDPSLKADQFGTQSIENVKTIAKFCRANCDIFKNLEEPSITAPQTPYSKTSINSKRQLGG